MESKNVIILSVWTFFTVTDIGLFWTGERYVGGIGGPYVAGVFLFFVALIFTAWVASWAPESKKQEIQLTNELESIKSKLDELAEEIQVIKKAIEE